MKKAQTKLLAKLSKKHNRQGSRNAFRKGKKITPSLWNK